MKYDLEDSGLLKLGILVENYSPFDLKFLQDHLYCDQQPVKNEMAPNPKTDVKGESSAFYVFENQNSICGSLVWTISPPKRSGKTARKLVLTYNVPWRFFLKLKNLTNSFLR